MLREKLYGLFTNRKLEYNGYLSPNLALQIVGFISVTELKVYMLTRLSVSEAPLKEYCFLRAKFFLLILIFFTWHIFRIQI